MQFRPLTDDDLNLCLPYFEMLKHTACDYTVGGVFMWRDMYATEMAQEDNCLYMRLYEEPGKAYYYLPMGHDVKGGIEKIVAHEIQKGRFVVRFCTVLKEYIPCFDGYDARIIPQFEFNDYLYAASDLISLEGKKYGGQRNLIRQFERLYPDNSLEPITAQNIEEVRAFFDSTFEARADGDNKLAENALVKSVLERGDMFGMFGAALYVEGKVVGFSVGETLGDTLYVHIEKADRNCKGAYQTLNNRFAKRYAADAQYINREDDMGDEGLRRAKLAYHPIRLIEKYIVEIDLKK